MPGFPIEPLLLIPVAVGLTGALVCFAIAFPRAVRELRATEAKRSDPAEAPSPPPATPDRAESRARVPADSGDPARRPPDLRTGLRESRRAFVGKLERLLHGRRELDAKTLDEIENLLFGADLGVRTADDLLGIARDAGSPDRVKERLQARALEILQATEGEPGSDPECGGPPRVVLVVGVNGSGKTTTVGRLAALARTRGERVLIAAADTFRAAAIDQIAVWAERAGVELVRGSPGGDPAAVAFDAVEAALARGVDLVLVDTAGRLQTHAGLMDELTKISRVIGRKLPGAPHEVLLVLDANTGQNAIRQAHEFSRAVGVTGIVLAKLDGTAKGGVVLGIAQEVGIPVRFVGIGEGLRDLCEFDAEAFVRALFASEVREASEGPEPAGAASMPA